MSTNFPSSPHTKGFVAFSRTMKNRWGNPCISHMTKYAIGWESNGKKRPYYGKSMSTKFPDFLHTISFVAFSHTVGNLWRNSCISHMLKYTRGWESNWKKSTHTMGKVWVSISQTFPIPLVLLYFPVLWEIYGETHTIPTWWHWTIFSCTGKN